jgi:hypothetical protein
MALFGHNQRNPNIGQDFSIIALWHSETNPATPYTKRPFSEHHILCCK